MQNVFFLRRSLFFLSLSLGRKQFISKNKNAFLLTWKHENFYENSRFNFQECSPRQMGWTIPWTVYKLCIILFTLNLSNISYDVFSVKCITMWTKWKQKKNDLNLSSFLKQVAAFFFIYLALFELRTAQSYTQTHWYCASRIWNGSTRCAPFKIKYSPHVLCKTQIFDIWPLHTSTNTPKKKKSLNNNNNQKNE